MTMDQLDARFLKKFDEFIDRALEEDAPQGDITSLACIPADSRSTARLLVKDAGVIAGISLAEYIFKKVDPESRFEKRMNDGDHASFGSIAFTVEANTRALLLAERVTLNLMQRLSGIATLANHFLFEVEDLPVKILDTRKTTPLLRFLEKWAVRLGGCHNYRDSLSDWFMIKDNHIKACCGVKAAIEQVAAYQQAKGLNLGVTVEVKNLIELADVLEVGKVTRIMFDNFEIPLLAEGVAFVDGRFETEASGGITIHNVRAVALTGVDYISVGAVTHSAQSLDMSLKVI
ncbi:MAG: carboxylating nicotinate-nucleotide diphosphorylase [Bacteroidetes bacterium]|nr:MAG: carboxylating nicotinate-nucleotide diphosphorylase [Bacteroidota bacterium]